MHRLSCLLYSLALSPDGQRLVSGSGDGAVRIWETFPLARRLDAIREAETCRQQTEKLVATLFAEETDYRRVVERIERDEQLNDVLRRTSLNTALRRAVEERYNVSKTVSHDVEN